MQRISFVQNKITDDWLKKIQSKEKQALKQVKKVFDLDQSDWQVVDFWQNCKNDRQQSCFVHDIWIYRLGNSVYVAKNEEVFEELDQCASRDYQNFASFVQSLFQYEESCVPVNTFSFLDEPEQKPVTFYRSYFLGKWDIVMSIQDCTKISNVTDAKIRELFVLYCKEKESIIQYQNKQLVNIYNRHGRDVINEVLASVFGFLLNVRVPQNYFGYKKFQYTRAYSEKPSNGLERFVVSKALCERMPCLDLKQAMQNVLDQQHKDKIIEEDNQFSVGTQKMAKEDFVDFKNLLQLNWHNANPFQICFKKSGMNYANTTLLRNFIEKNFVHYKDMIQSHVLDQIFGASKDRKIEEFVLPEGNTGRIFTVDYGEILFPELSMPQDEPHYQFRKKSEWHRIKLFLQNVTMENKIYKQAVAETILNLAFISKDFVLQFVHSIPDVFFKYYWDENRFCYFSQTLADYLLSLIAQVRYFFMIDKDCDFVQAKEYIWAYYCLD